MKRMMMAKIYCIKCKNYRKFKNSKISCIFSKISGFSIICDKYGSSDDKLFKEEKSIETSKILALTDNVNE